MSGPREVGRWWDPVWQPRLRPARIVVVLGLLVLLLLLALPALLRRQAEWLIDTDPPCRADVAVVLGGGVGERLGAAVRIWREGRVPAILITGPDTPLLPVYTGGDTLTQGEVKRRIAIGRGVPEADAWLLLGATSTYEEAVLVRADLERRGLTSAIVVTSPYHSRRAGRTFRHLFRGSGIRLSVETLPLEMSQDDPEGWWTREHDLMTVFSETVKLLYYWNHYGIAPV